MTALTQTAPAPSGESRLKELSDSEFEARYGCDRFTASVLASRFRYLVKHMCTHLMTNAFSPIIRDWYDFAATLSGPPELDYPMAAVSDSLALFTGVMAPAVRNTVEEYGAARLKPGDILISNDPYRTGTHPNDVLFVRPVFHDGRLIGTMNLQAHMIDIGGTIPGGFGPGKQSLYENGLVIPPMLMFEDDEPIRSTFSLILDNARFGMIMLPDFMSIAADLRLGERQLGEALEKYGVGAYLGALRYVTDLSAEAFRDAVAATPDGVYEGDDLIDCDGLDASLEYRVAVKITIAGSRLEVDLSGSSAQARTSINAGWFDTVTAVGIALKFLFTPTIPFTSGHFRHIDTVIPPGSITHALPPAAIVFFFDVSESVVEATFRAMAKALGENAIAGGLGGMSHLAHGLRADGTPWQTIGTIDGAMAAWGATKRADAESSLTYYVSTCIAPSVEAIESDAPVVVLCKEYATDSAGAGLNRGGSSIRKDSLWLTESYHYPNVIHVKRPSGEGVYGGRSGRGGAVWYWEAGRVDGDFVGTSPEDYLQAEPVAGMIDPRTHLQDSRGDYVHFGRKPVWHAQPGAIFRYESNAGGGWGDPLQREPERVLRDVRDEYTSIQAARAVYGVVIEGDPVGDPEGLALDLEATRQLRGQMSGC
ncbi:MAG: hydantoinase B/oxoprolinase family protein [Solirubrobacterales bacterium]|nr:hydantoinase B/oxoprolinase family protein [Solirubrobacterales bacterium]